MEVRIPSLGERAEDLPILVDHFVRKESEKVGKEITGVTQKATDYLCQRNWEGNVRELENLIESAVKRADRLITLKDVRESTSETDELKLSTHHGCTKDEPAKDCPVFKDAEMGQIEKVAIINALKANQGLVEPASKALGISKASMYNKIKEFGLSDMVRGYAGR